MATHHHSPQHHRLPDPHRVPLEPDLGVVIAAFERQRELLQAAADHGPTRPARTRRRFLRRLP